MLTIHRYKHVPAKTRPTTSIVSQTLPITAMFLKNKLIGWASLFVAVQSVLNEPSNSSKEEGADQPAFLKIVLAMVSVLVNYLDLFFPKTSTAARVQEGVETSSTATSSSIVSSATSSSTSR